MLAKKSNKKPEVIGAPKVPFMRRQSVLRIAGSITLLLSLSLFVQAVPLMFVFVGVYLGLAADATIGNMDTMIWILTCIAIMIVALYVFLAWLKYVWYFFMVKKSAKQAVPFMRK